MQSTIDDVIDQLDAIVRTSIAEQSPLGYFPALYQRVTTHVHRAIQRGDFEDNERMERFDTIFAQRYLDAYRDYRAGKPVTESWQSAFSAAANRHPITLQHLLLGMNAHISLDLGIAAAEVAGPDPLALKNDFFHINEILGSLVDDTQERLTHIFGPLGLVDSLLGPVDEQLSLFSIAYARDKAWTQTLELCFANPEQRQAIIAQRDASVARFAQCLYRPRRLLLRCLLLCVRLLEKGNVAKRIKLLDSEAER